MAYASNDHKGWTAVFRPLGGVGKHRQRIPPSLWRGQPDERAAARAHALSCDAACRQIESGVYRPADVRRALGLRAISEEQAAALLTSNPLPTAAPKGSEALTLEAAALAHPSSAHDVANRWRYLQWLGEFRAFAGITAVHELTIDHVQRWIASRRQAGDAWDTRRHRLLFVRRAARMGSALRGLPDPLSGFRLDRAERREPVEVYTLQELARAARAFQKAEDPRALAALGMGAFVGLRPSECAQALVGDIDGDVLTTGRKTASSARRLPLPPTVAGWLRKLAGDRPADSPLIYSLGGGGSNDPAKRAARRGSTAFTLNTFSQWLTPLLAEATGRRLPAKTLRKSFATWTTRMGLDVQHVEAYLGHQSAMVERVTARHYLGQWLVESLRPTAKRIDAEIRTAIGVSAGRRSIRDTPKVTPRRKPRYDKAR